MSIEGEVWQLVMPLPAHQAAILWLLIAQLILLLSPDDCKSILENFKHLICLDAQVEPLLDVIVV